MKKTPVFFLLAIALVLSVGLYSCSQQENGPTSSNPEGGLLLKPEKPTVTISFVPQTLFEGGTTDITVCATTTLNSLVGKGKLTVEETFLFGGARTDCAADSSSQILEHYVEAGDTTSYFTACFTWDDVPVTGGSGTFGYKGAFAPNLAKGPNKLMSGAGVCDTVHVDPD